MLAARLVQLVQLVPGIRMVRMVQPAQLVLAIQMVRLVLLIQSDLAVPLVRLQPALQLVPLVQPVLASGSFLSPSPGGISTRVESRRQRRGLD